MMTRKPTRVLRRETLEMQEWKTREETVASMKSQWFLGETTLTVNLFHRSFIPPVQSVWISSSEVAYIFGVGVG